MEDRLGFYVNSVKINDGTEISLTENDIVIFVGNNNVGKSAAIKNIYTLCGTSGFGNIHDVVTAIKTSTIGSFKKFEEHLFELSEYDDKTYPILLGSIKHEKQQLKNWWESASRNHNTFFRSYLSTANRIAGSDPVKSVDFSQTKATHPILKMFVDDSLEEHINSYFRLAFNEELLINRYSGQQIYLHVGARPIIETSDKLLTKYYAEVKSLPQLNEQGDGMRSFATILLELSLESSTVLLIDEPEAFLHPPQIRLLGKFISKNYLKKQIFISTHSPDFIRGLLQIKNERVKIVRLKRNGTLNYSSLLDNSDIAELTKDPVLRHSQIVDGLFHEKVIICESDGDCKFYSSILDVLNDKNAEYYKVPDSLFIPAHGKSKMPEIARALSKLSVSVISICDFDIFNNISPLKDLVEAHGGNWKNIEGEWKKFKNAIDSIKSQLDKEEVKMRINEILDKVNVMTLGLKDLEKIKEVLKMSTAWSFAKKQGISFIPSGENYNSCANVTNYLNTIGIFPLMVGELESFDKTISNSNKALWLEEVFKKDLTNSEVLKEAKEFVSSIMNFV